MTLWHAYVIYALAWLSFGVGHSLLAQPAVKTRFRPLFGAGYRLAYNLFAAAHIAAVLVVGRWAFAGAEPFALPPWAVAPMTAVQIAGALVLAIALRAYDLGRFAGLTQIKNARAGKSEPEDEPLRTQGPHRFVRHPLYAGLLLILWGRIADPFDLATALWASAYIALGIVLEEKKLIALYGMAYVEYRRRVPALIPWKGRAL
jgi:protein-S-isoprenylcysteine O-methyltransferase Ste14